MGRKRKVKIEYDEVVKRFARRLRELRVERGMTQADLARRAHVTATYVSKLESAGAAPGIDLVEKLATSLGAEITDLIPIAPIANHSAVAREQARDLFDNLLKTADQQTFALLNPFLALLVESSGNGLE
jgi:transcriptional regulator with XRE-family HTH domain